MILVYLQIGGSKAVRSVMSPTAAAITNNLDTAALLCIITCDNYDMLRAGKSPAFRCLSACRENHRYFGMLFDAIFYFRLFSFSQKEEVVSRHHLVGIGDKLMSASNKKRVARAKR